MGNPDAARAFVEEVLRAMQNNSLHRQRIDWAGLRSQVVGALGAAATIDDTKPALLIALRALGDNHSLIQSPNGALWLSSGFSCGAATRVEPTVPSDVGYVWVRSLSGGSDGGSYMQALKADLARQDRDDLAGWIVDLRANYGGNMWPMIAGVGPLLGDGVVGHFIAPVGAPAPWTYANGSSFLNGARIAGIDAPHVRKSRSARVAVLTDGSIASSGEATVIAFIGRPETRSFGQPTCGLSTGNTGLALTTGHTLLLTTSFMADRTQRPYGAAVVPDEVVDGAASFDRAVTWLREGR